MCESMCEMDSEKEREEREREKEMEREREVPQRGRRLVGCLHLGVRLKVIENKIDIGGERGGVDDCDARGRELSIDCVDERLAFVIGNEILRRAAHTPDQLG